MVAIRQQLVTGGNRRVSAGTNPASYITVHETANTSAGADADAHARYLQGGPSVSWHYTVDDKEAVQHYEHTARCWHTGTSAGNNSSIGVEICVNRDGDFDKAVKNAIELVAHLMKQEGIPASNVVQHNRWSGKNCPTNLRNGKAGGWENFIKSLGGAAPSQPAPAPVSGSLADLAQRTIRGEFGSGETRKNALGARYTEVQNEVNRILSGTTPANVPIGVLVQEVLAGKHGHGEARKKSLGARYNEVQAEVNKHFGIGGKAPLKPLAQIAREVYQGHWGNGAAREANLRRAGYNAAAVQAEVNRRYY